MKKEWQPLLNVNTNHVLCKSPNSFGSGTVCQFMEGHDGKHGHEYQLLVMYGVATMSYDTGYRFWKKW